MRDPASHHPEQLPTLDLVVAFADGGHGANAWVTIPAGGAVVLGGAAFRDPRMSDRHAEVRREGAALVVRDLASAAGTQVNGRGVEGLLALASGDVLRLGDTLLVVAPIAFGEKGSDAPPESELVGASAAMVGVRRSIQVVARHACTVVIVGETGTGKEVVARALHQQSGRRGGFVAVNCSTFTDTLLASELFGHVRGAFTGAVAQHLGLFRSANHGTLLLDEVADLPLALQAQLLRVLETRQVRPVGGADDIDIDVRVVATTNRELADLVREGKFRPDLHARLAQWTIRTPPLAQRREDIPALTLHLLERSDAGRRRVSPDLAEALLVDAWTLNVRGLLNVLFAATLSAPDDRGPLVLGPDVRAALSGVAALPIAVYAAPAKLDREALERLMSDFSGRVAAAARAIGVTRPRLYRWLWGHGVDPASFRRPRRT